MLHSLLRTLLTGCFATAVAFAQSSLTTTFTPTQQVGTGGATYFDLVVANPSGIVVRGLDLLLNDAGLNATVAIYACATTRTGQQTTAASWTQVATANVVSAGSGQPTAATFPPFALPGGTNGLAIHTTGLTQYVFTGPSASSPWSNGELTLQAGECSTALFTGPLQSQCLPTIRLHYESRMATPFDGTGSLFNSTIYFDLNVLHPNGVTFTGLALRLGSASGQNGTARVYTCAATRTGKQQNQAAWTQVATGSVTSAGTSVYSTVNLTTFALPAGSVGMAIELTGLSHRYTLSNGSYQNADLQIAGGELTSAPFAGTLSTARRVNCRFQYYPGPASHTTFGTGCTAQYASMYETFDASKPFDLSGTAFRLTPSGAGYVAYPASFANYRTPSAAAVPIVLGDDSEAPTPLLLAPFPHAGGTSARLVVCSNGYVSTDYGNGIGYQPNVPELLNSAATCFRVWRDLDPSLAGSGPVLFEQVFDLAVITWNGVRSFGGGPSETNTFQMQFHCFSGEVTVLVGQLAPFTNWSPSLMVGYSPAGLSQEPLVTDISAIGAIGWPLQQDGVLSLGTGSEPIYGRSIEFTTSGMHPATLLGTVFVSLAAYPAGLSLAPLMPGCMQYTDALVMLPPFLGGATSRTTSFAVPLAVGGLFHAQSIVLAPSVIANAISAATSNGLSFHIGSY